MSNPINKKDIAIVGMSGAFPQSANIDELWDHLINADELIHFYSKEELEKLNITPNPEKKEVFAEARIAESNTFDNFFFGFDSEEAFYMDPQIRKFFEHTWLAMEDAGYDITELEERIGVFAAASDNLNWRSFAEFAQSKNISSFYLKQIANKNYMNTLISYKLNFRGPSYSINTACSSSLVAIHLACRNLLLRECSIAIAGAARIKSTEEIGYQYQEGMIMSNDGHCRAFDANSSGTIFGEGVGVVVLKRLEDAIRDNDQVYAVIKGSSTNNDGSNKIGFTAPSVEGQYDCIRQAHLMAKMDPATISFIEAHGTGTKIGDSIEIESLNKAFNFETEKKCAIGSIKTNLGHLDAVSGVAGVIKASLAIKNRVLPASLHFESSNDNINFADGPFYVNTTNKEFDADTVIRAGISSFGMGGTNAHVLLEETPVSNSASEEKMYHIVGCSAKTENSLLAYEDKLTTYLEEKEALDLGHVSFTTLTGRATFKHRSFMLVHKGEIVQTKRNSIENGDNNTLVFMFTGQGSQYFQMGADLYTSEPIFRSILNDGFDLIEKITGENIKHLLLGTNPQEEKLRNTKYSQPILFLFEYALSKTLSAWGVVPDKMIGHSLGEFVAACLSEVFTFEQALKLVIKRGALMSEMPEGSMLAINQPLEQVEKFLNETLDVATINTDHSCVISGEEIAIEQLKTKLDAEGISAVVLQTSHAFHSRSMDAMLEPFREVLETLDFGTPKIPFVSNVTGTYITDEMATSTAYWVSHLRNTVLFSKGIDTLLEDERSIFLEIGPGAALSTMVKQKTKEKTWKVKTLNTIGRRKEKGSLDKPLLNALGTLWLDGIPVDWAAYFAEKKAARVSVPTYPFEKNVFPVTVNPLKKLDINVEAIVSEAIPDSVQLPVAKRELGNKLVAPTNSVEETLVEIWKDFFKLDDVGITDDFFELGGDSLQTIVLINQINKEFDMALSIENLYDTSNIKELASILNFSMLQKQGEDTSGRDGDELII